MIRRVAAGVKTMFYTCQAGALDKAEVIFDPGVIAGRMDAKLQCLRKPAKKPGGREVYWPFASL